MSDTLRGFFPDIPCSDCGDEEKGQVYIKHWGPMVPPGKVGCFGPNCWAARMLLDKNKTPRPLGSPYIHREHLMDDWELLTFGRDKLAEREEDTDKLLALLRRVNEAKIRFANTRQMFKEAVRLREIEREIQETIEALTKDR